MPTRRSHTDTTSASGTSPSHGSPKHIDTYARTPSPADFASATTGSNTWSASSRERFRLRLANDSVALAKTQTSFTPQSRARRSPDSLGTSAGRRTPSGGVRTSGPSAKKTSSASASWGTQEGFTKLDTSTVLRPASRSRRTNSALTRAATIVASFCRPSRGPTSQIVTGPRRSRRARREGRWVVISSTCCVRARWAQVAPVPSESAPRSCRSPSVPISLLLLLGSRHADRFHLRQGLVEPDGLARPHEHRRDRPLGGRRDDMLHLHRFDDNQHLPRADLLTGSDVHRDDDSGHRAGHRSRSPGVLRAPAARCAVSAESPDAPRTSHPDVGAVEGAPPQRNRAVDGDLERSGPDVPRPGRHALRRAVVHAHRRRCRPGGPRAGERRSSDAHLERHPEGPALDVALRAQTKGPLPLPREAPTVRDLPRVDDASRRIEAGHDGARRHDRRIPVGFRVAGAKLRQGALHELGVEPAR